MVREEETGGLGSLRKHIITRRKEEKREDVLLRRKKQVKESWDENERKEVNGELLKKKNNKIRRNMGRKNSKTRCNDKENERRDNKLLVMPQFGRKTFIRKRKENKQSEKKKRNGQYEK